MAILKVAIVGDASSASKAFDKTAKKSEALAKKFKSLEAPAIAAAGAMGLGAKKLIDYASQAEQAAGAVQAVFKSHTQDIEKFAKSAADKVGLPAAEVQEMSALLGSQLKNFGVPLDQLAGQTTDLIDIAADLSAQFGGTTSDAVAALSSLLRGERDPIEKYGIAINQAAIDAEKARLGLDKLTGAAAQNANLQATLSLLTKQAGDAQGAAAREYNTAASSAQRATANLKNQAAELGQKLLPAYTRIMNTATQVAKVIGEHPVIFERAALAVAALVGAVLAVNGAMRVYAATSAVIAGGKGIITGITATANMLGRVRDGYVSAAAASSVFSGTAGTIGGKLRVMTTALRTATIATGQWVVAQSKAAATAVATAAKATAAWVASAARTTAALVAQAAAFVAQKAVMLASAVATGVMTAAQWAMNVAMAANPVGIVIAAIVALIGLIVLLWNKCAWFRDGVKAIATAVGQAFQWIGQKVGEIASWVATAFKTHFDVVKTVVTTVITFVKTFIDAHILAIKTAVGWIGDAFKNAFTIAKNIAVAHINAIKNAIGFLIDKIKTAINWVKQLFNRQPPAWVKNIQNAFTFSAPEGAYPAGGPTGLTASASPTERTLSWLTAAANPASGSHVTFKPGAIRIDNADDPDKAAQKIVEKLDQYFARRGKTWR